LRQPLRSKGTRQTISSVKSYPAPVGGWNARDALAAMPPTDAIVLNNWFPRTSYVEIRGGFSNHLTGMTNNGKTLAVYNGLTGTNKMFAITSSGTYDASSAGAAGASVAARTNGKHQWLNFGDGTNNYLILVNGVDKPLYFDGTSWVAVDGVSVPALTGLTTTRIISVFESKGRLFFIEKDSLSFWYLAAGAAGGALTEFDLSGVAKKGGFLMAGSTWTVDAGDGPDDRVVFVTSEGEVIVYSGTNPSVAASWVLVGVYELGKPLGRRCVTRYGGDLLILTQNGSIPMAAAIGASSKTGEPPNKFALSFKIENAFTDAARSYGSIFGWEQILYPAQAALLVNVPISEDGEHQQYVMNTITKSWCRFTDWDAEDFAVFNGELYFTTGTKVVKAWTGAIDGANNITAYGKTAFSYFGSSNLEKKFKLFRPVLAVNGTVNFLTDIDVDFQDTPITGTATYSVVSGGLWDSSNWDQAFWAAGLEIVKGWTSPDEFSGKCGAGKIQIATNSLNIQWMACDYVFETGGII
jgi:hypothetical protein